MSNAIPEVPKYVEPQNFQPHCRIAIRRWIKQLMIVNTDIKKENWFLSRPDPMFDQEAPFGLIYFNDEGADTQDLSPRNYLRTTQIVIQPARRMDTIEPQDLEDWLDSRAYEIEIAMLTDRFLGQKDFIEDTVLVRTQPAQLKIENADAHHSSIGIFFNIMWRSSFGLGAQTLDEFFSFLTEMEIGDEDTKNPKHTVIIRTN